MNLEELEKYYEKKYSENITVLHTKQKATKYIEILEGKIKSKLIERDNYNITVPIRNRSLFDNKCKYCEKGCVKDNDRFHYLKYTTCTDCYIIHEER